MYAPEHVAGWRRITDFVHANSRARFCLQLGHSGGKGSTRLGWEGMDAPLEAGNWPLIAASDVAWSADNQAPRPMTRADMDAVRDAFVAATRMAIEAGFDMIELHAAHGYLLSSFITPLLNKRDDDYGGSLANRLRFPLEVFAAMRAAWPAERPMSVRISANDWAGEQGIMPPDAVEIARAFAEAGADLIDVSAGQTWAEAKPVYGRMFQTPFADRIRNEAKLATMAVGNIYEADHANSILAAGRADLVALARPHLIDPMWTLRQAAAADYRGTFVPPPYLAGQEQLARILKRSEGRHEGEGMKLAGQHALITGGGTGIGAAIARALAGEGAALTLVGRRRAPLDAVASELGATVAVADVTDRAAVDRAFGEARAGAWARHHPDRQCGRGRECAVRQDRRRCLAADDGGQPRRRVPLLPGGASRPEGGARRADRDGRVDRRPQGLCLYRRLCRREARRGRADARAGRRTGGHERHRQRRVPGLHRYRSGRRGDRHDQRENRAAAPKRRGATWRTSIRRGG